MYSCHSILECYNLFSGVKLSIILIVLFYYYNTVQASHCIQILMHLHEAQILDSN